MRIGVSDRYLPRFRPKPRRLKPILVMVLIGGLGVFIWSINRAKSNNNQVLLTTSLSDQLNGPEEAITPSSLLDGYFGVSSRQYDEIRGGESLFSALRRMQVPARESEILAEALGKQLKLRSLKPGDVLMVENGSPACSVGCLVKRTSR